MIYNKKMKTTIAILALLIIGMNSQGFFRNLKKIGQKSIRVPQISSTNIAGGCIARQTVSKGNLNTSDFQHGKPAMGFQYDNGAKWAVVCTDTAYGSVPGKLTVGEKASFPWGGKEHDCPNRIVVYGELVSNKEAIPCGCDPLGHQTNDGRDYYNAIIPSQHGMVPGKARKDRTWAWYGWGNKEHAVQDNFYIIC